MTRTSTHHSVPTPALGDLHRTGTATVAASSVVKAPASSRRAVLAGGAAVLALAAGTVAANAAPPASLDSELVALCARLDGLQREVDRLFPADWHGMADAALEAADIAARCIEGEQRRLLHRICVLPPATPAGCAAVARSLATLRPDLVGAAANADMDVRLTALLVCGLTGEGA